MHEHVADFLKDTDTASAITASRHTLSQYKPGVMSQLKTDALVSLDLGTANYAPHYIA